jgi:hypothetical protein
VPKTKTSNTKSGRRKAAKKSERSWGAKKWTSTLCLTNPKILEHIIINMMTVAADITLFCGETRKFFPFWNNLNIAIKPKQKIKRQFLGDHNQDPKVIEF